MVLTKYSAGKHLWGDKTIDANTYLDALPPHVLPVAGDLDINTIIDAIQNTSTGHHHDGTDSRTLYSVLDSRYLQLLTSTATQVSNPSTQLANDHPGLIFNDTNCGISIGGEGPVSGPIPLRIISNYGANPVGGAIDFLPASPAMQMWQPSSQVFLPILLAFGIPDLNQNFNMLLFDVGNFQGRGALSLIWGDDGTIGGTATGDNYFLTGAHAPTVEAFSYYGTEISQSADPTTSQIPSGKFMVIKNTTSGAVKLWVNDGGTMKSVAMT
jgi:hypothetical protein